MDYNSQVRLPRQSCSPDLAKSGSGPHKPSSRDRIRLLGTAVPVSPHRPQDRHVIGTRARGPRPPRR
uniref:Uncharacterized protein n=1 Tax=Zea mays TaxID=4577 RepID=C0P2A8_MAIZE|nr:unknown [Zea mays]